jgi:RNA polymerase sigma-70 factor (ECF subfamily)
MIRGGDRRAFDTLVERYVTALNVFALRIIGESESARDVVQDAFVCVWENRHKIDCDDHLRNYLYLAVRNYSLNVVKRRSRTLGTLGAAAANAAEPTAQEDISAEYVRVETARILVEAIGQLPHSTAEVLRMSLDGVKQEEIARRLGMSLATVKALKAKGIARLREILGPLSVLFPFLWGV